VRSTAPATIAIGPRSGLHVCAEQPEEIGLELFALFMTSLTVGRWPNCNLCRAVVALTKDWGGARIQKVSPKPGMRQTVGSPI